MGELDGLNGDEQTQKLPRPDSNLDAERSAGPRSEAESYDTVPELQADGPWPEGDHSPTWPSLKAFEQDMWAARDTVDLETFDKAASDGGQPNGSPNDAWTDREGQWLDEFDAAIGERIERENISRIPTQDLGAPDQPGANDSGSSLAPTKPAIGAMPPIATPGSDDPTQPDPMLPWRE